MCAGLVSARADQSSYKTRSVLLPAVKSRRQNVVFLLPAASLLVRFRLPARLPQRRPKKGVVNV